jgi:hypothetical protein
MNRWAPKQAARLGFLAGRGSSLDALRSDPLLRGRSEQSLCHAATQWRVKFGSGGAPKDDAMLSIHVTPTDREVLEQAAAERGLSTASFTASLVHVITSERLLQAVMDDSRD